MSEVTALRRTLPPDVSIELRTGVAQGSVAIHPGELGQLVKNLVDNAVYSMGGCGTVTIQVDECRVADAEAVRLQIPVGRYGRFSVCDHGPGIGPGLLERIFEPFFTSKDIGQGTGLGLSIVQGIIRSRGGTVTVRNRPEGGAAFEILLPSFDRPADPADDGRERPRAGRRGMTFGTTINATGSFWNLSRPKSFDATADVATCVLGR